MSTTATDERVGRLPSRVTWLSGVHFLIALVLLVAVPPVLNEVLHDSFFPANYVWVQHGELKGWASSTLDEFFLATPYWASYEPGWIIGLLPGLLVASAAWGLRKQRAWGRQLAIGFHAVTAVVALAAIAWAVYGYGAMEWAFLQRGPKRGRTGQSVRIGRHSVCDSGRGCIGYPGCRRRPSVVAPSARDAKLFPVDRPTRHAYALGVLHRSDGRSPRARTCVQPHRGLSRRGHVPRQVNRCIGSPCWHRPTPPPPR